LLPVRIANRILDKYSTNTEASNYLFYLLLHPTRILCAVPFCAKAIRKRFLLSANPPKYYPQYIHTVYEEIKYSNPPSEACFYKSCFEKSSVRPESDYQGDPAKLIY